MKKIFKYILFTFLLSFIYTFNVNAECSYQERKELLEKAKNVEAFFEPDVDNNKFVFYLFNLDNDLFVELENINNKQLKKIYKYEFDTEYYTMDESNVSDIINYKLTIYSNKSECYSNHVTSKNIKKGIINKFYKEDICKDIEDYKYCVPILNKKIRLSDDEIRKDIKEYKDSIKVKEETILDKRFGLDDLLALLKTYWYIPVSILSILLIIFVIIYINKKRGELK